MKQILPHCFMRAFSVEVLCYSPESEEVYLLPILAMLQVKGPLGALLRG